MSKRVSATGDTKTNRPEFDRFVRYGEIYASQCPEPPPMVDETGAGFTNRGGKARASKVAKYGKAGVSKQGKENIGQ